MNTNTWNRKAVQKHILGRVEPAKPEATNEKACFPTADEDAVPPQGLTVEVLKYLESFKAEVRAEARADLQGVKDKLERVSKVAVWPVQFRGFMEAAAKWMAAELGKKEYQAAGTGALLKFCSLHSFEMLTSRGGFTPPLREPSRTRRWEVNPLFDELRRLWPETCREVHDLADLDECKESTEKYLKHKGEVHVWNLIVKEQVFERMEAYGWDVLQEEQRTIQEDESTAALVRHDTGVLIGKLKPSSPSNVATSKASL